MKKVYCSCKKRRLSRGLATGELKFICDCPLLMEIYSRVAESASKCYAILSGFLSKDKELDRHGRLRMEPLDRLEKGYVVAALQAGLRWW